MADQVGDLISFDDTGDLTFNSQDGSLPRRAPDFRRVILSEIQYYRTSPTSPTKKYAFTDIKPTENLSDKDHTHSLVPNPVLIFEDEPPPPLPPKHYEKSKADSIVKRRSQLEIDDFFSDSSINHSDALSKSAPETIFTSPLDKFAPESLDQFDPFVSEKKLLVRGSKMPDLKPDRKNDGPGAVQGSGLFHLSLDDSESTRETLDRRQVKTLSSKELMQLSSSYKEKPNSNQKSQTLPLRPPPPKSRFSCPPAVLALSENQSEVEKEEEKLETDHENIFFKTGLFQKTEERNDEAVAFSNSIAKLRKIYKNTDKSTNPGYISAAKIKNKALLNTTREMTVYFDPDPIPRRLTCSLSSTPNDLILNFFSDFQNGNSSYHLDVIAEQYVLKFAGTSTFLTDDCSLCDYVTIQECIKYGYTIDLVLIRTKYINTDFKRDEEDDMKDCQGTYFDYYFNETKSGLSISQQGLLVLLETYNDEAARLIKDIFETHKVSYLPERIIQVVKAITKSLAQVELLSVQDGVNMLLSLKRFTRTMSSLGDPNRRRINEFFNPIHFDRERFHYALQNLTRGVHAVIELYCKAFNTNFQIQSLGIAKVQAVTDNVYERVDPRTIDDKFSVKVASIYRIPSTWKHEYTGYFVEAALHYGGNLLCQAKRTSQMQICIGFFEHIRFYELLEFDLAVCNVPRETKVTFKLIGLSVPKKGEDGRTVLGWVSCNVYDYQGFLLSGSRLFGLISDTDFNPVATCATGYIQRQETVILKADFQVYHTEVLFPQPVLITPSTLNGGACLSEAEMKYVLKMSRKDSRLLTEEERFVIWKSRYDLSGIPSALKHVLVSCPAWDSINVVEVHAILSSWEALSPVEAIEFLQADFPDKTIRETAVLWLSKIEDDELVDYLPELVQAIKYESYHDSALAQFLIKRSLSSPRVAHFLFWHLKYYTGDLQFSQRFQIVLSGLLNACGRRLQNQMQQQDNLVVHLTKVALKIKQCKDTVRQSILIKELKEINDSDVRFPLRLPLEPSLKLGCLLPEECSYFSSNTVPLKVAMENVDMYGRNCNVIFKIGDDLRKDLVTLLMFRVMNKLWLNEGLDLKMMLYNVLPTGPLCGLIEIVPNAATFREIHIQHGLTGSFKDDSLILWLQKFNTTEADYHRAIENFTFSAAGYCVATYLLGIGDRHNDNIMLTKNGHLFHIDFSKFMGDVQKFGSISRDRVPFVLTPDMAYVINNGLTPTPNFQTFIESCCQSFNIIRRNKHVILNLLGLMVYSGIPYLSGKEDLLFIRRNLQLHLTDEEATMYFTRLIESSLSSRSTQLNFFIHNIAHMKNVSETTLGSSKSSPLFSFSNTVQTKDKDGAVDSARIVDFQKRYLPEKHYVFVINVTRVGVKEPKFIFRRFEDFQELHAKLSYKFNVFTGVILPDLPAKVLLGRSQIREVAHRRRHELDKYLVELSEVPELWESDIVYTFLHSYIKDTEEARRFSEYVELLAEGPRSRIGGKIKLSICYKNGGLHVLVMHCSDLIPDRLQGLADPFVKIQVLPDPSNYYKKKTRICRKSLNPTFNETLVFDAALEYLEKRVLQITVWDSSNIMGKEFLGGMNCYLSTLDVSKPKNNWYALVNIQI